MSETRREKFALYFGGIVTIMPAVIMSGFTPEWNVLPAAGWIAVATVGAAVAGVIATPRTVPGAIAGALTGFGLILGVWAYVELRVALTGSSTFWQAEIAIGAMIGAAPGALLFHRWAREPLHYTATVAE